MTTPAAPILDRSARVQRVTDVLSAEVDGEAVLMSIEKGCYFGLDDIGSDVWRRLEEPVGIAALAASLADDYDGDPAVIERDVIALLSDMAANGLVTVG
ncbi:PqqD family protein [Azospirillum sp.]|uniref:PqqD family protein n=1 Tax=Azospirillum sp. TaxID=34012 RepID=UPI002D718947|nr:PqqD family protein [Azospirillum sp.]HYD69826.1 PqqD family protein [Azospirillum sp.]